jgi:arsenate reductase
LLQEYTFLKRPFMINEEQVFIGNSKNEIAAAKESFSK